MEKSKVVIIKCEDYEMNKIYNSLKKALDLLGSIKNITKDNKNILVKPNNLVASNPEDIAITNPIVFESLLKILSENDYNISYGDSPGFGNPTKAIEKSGFKAIGDKYNAKIADFDNGKTIEYNEGLIAKKFEIVNACQKGDFLISLSKAKTHQLTRITGAIKNQYGCVQGINKAAYHLKFSNPIDFSKMLLDLNKLLKPGLFIMDGIIAMQGNGPRGGEPIKTNFILVSTDPIALDTIFCKIININPKYVPTIKYSKEFNIGTFEEDKIELLGDDIGQFIRKDFNIKRYPITKNTIIRKLPYFLRKQFQSRLDIDKTKCTKCAICVNACPLNPKAINFKDENKKDPPIYNHKSCIKCFCCQEMCPNKAIELKKPFLRKLIKKN